MHDPLVVAFEIRRPWPKRSGPISKKTPRWEISIRSPFWMLAGRCYYFPSLVTVWHREPGGRDSGEVCKHYRRYETIDGWKTKILIGWRFHIHHWKIQVRPLQELRRKLLTRCEWCGGKHSKKTPVNVSRSWHGEKSPLWKGERGLYHVECSSVPHAKSQCLCEHPMTKDGSMYADCELCGKRRYGSIEPKYLAVRRLYATVPDGHRPSDELVRQVRELAR